MRRDPRIQAIDAGFASLGAFAPQVRTVKLIPRQCDTLPAPAFEREEYPAPDRFQPSTQGLRASPTCQVPLHNKPGVILKNGSARTMTQVQIVPVQSQPTANDDTQL